MAKLYPRKQTVIIFIVCIVVIALMIWYSYGQKTPQKQNQQGTIATASENINQVSTTSVSTDWQKQFFGSATSSVKLSAKKTDTTTEAPLTFTDQLGREYFAQYMMAKQAGLEEDADVMNSINNRFIGRVANIANPTIYFMKDTSILPDSGINQIAEYGKNLMKILSNLPAEDAAIIANDAFNNGDMALLEKIDPIIAKYESIVSGLRVLPIPQSASQYHLDLLNSISVALYNAKSLRNVEKDPTQGLAALGIYVTGLQNIITALSNIQDYFTSNGIVFSS